MRARETQTVVSNTIYVFIAVLLSHVEQTAGELGRQVKSRANMSNQHHHQQI